MYRDELAIGWDKFLQAPVRRLMSCVTKLTLRRLFNCKHDCRRFHAALEEPVESVVLDVWGKRFQRLEGGREEPAKADMFCAFFHIPASALAGLHASNCAGVYFEPRSADASADNDFAVIWLPGLDLAAVRHHLQTCDRSVAVARLGRKYGIRVREADEQHVFKQLKPDQTFVKVKISAKYRLFPLPHGFPRTSVLQLLRKWEWQARPLQPCKGDGTGTVGGWRR